MTLAMRWLSGPGISMADIAERIGYGSASAFSVAFYPLCRDIAGQICPPAGRREMSPDQL